MRFISILLSTFLLFFACCRKKADSTIDETGVENGVCQYPEPVPIEKEAVLVFVIQHSLRIPDNRITVQLLPDGENYRLNIDSQPMPDFPQMEYTRYHREKMLSKKDCNYLQSLLEQINWKTLEKEDSLGVDGEIWSMKYKTDGTVRNVQLFCPYDEPKSEYIAFLDAAKVLLTFAELDYNRLTEPEIYEPTINTKVPREVD